MEKSYAQAIAAILAKGTDEKVVADSLVSQLKSSGRMKLLPGILRELRVLESRNETLAAIVEVASAKDKSAALEGAKEVGIEASDVVVNPDLIAGWRARSGSTLVDRSAKESLLSLYRRITT